MKGSEICKAMNFGLKAQHMSNSGTWGFNKTQPHLRSQRELFARETVFTLRGKRYSLHVSNLVSQAEEPTEQCVSQTMSVCVFPSWSKGVNRLWRDP